MLSLFPLGGLSEVNLGLLLEGGVAGGVILGRLISELVLKGPGLSGFLNRKQDEKRSGRRRVEGS